MSQLGLALESISSEFDMEKWYRVSKKHPCAICRRPDWCTYTDSVVCCMRIESEKQMGNGGWLHRKNEPITFVAAPRKAIEDKPLDAEGMWRQWTKRTASNR